MPASAPQVFMSYAHTDNQKIEGANLGWIDRFHEGLEMELNELGLDFTFWRDKRDLERDGFFDEKILAAVAASRVLVAILSPVYPKRPYCLKELSHFVEKAGGGPPPSAERVIKVVKQPLDNSLTDELPEYLNAQLGFDFYSVDRQANKITRFIRRDGEIVGNEFWDRIFELARAIKRHLTSSAVPQRESNGTVYLAETSQDVEPAYRTVRAELMAKGVRILPSQPLPPREKQALAAIDDDLARADFSIHLLGQRSGFIPEGDSGTPIARLQLERAAAQAKAKSTFRRLIWANPQLSPVDPAQDELLRGLSQGNLLHDRDEFVRETLELFKNTLIDVVSTYRSTPVAATRQTRPIFVIYDRNDASAGSEVRRGLFDLGQEVFRPDYSGDDEIERQAFAAFASQADAAVVVFGKTHEAWVQQTLLRLKDLQGPGRRSPLRSTAVLMVGEATPAKSDFLTRLADVTLDATATPLRDELEHFVKQLSP